MPVELLRALVAVDGDVDRATVESVVNDDRLQINGVGDPSTGWPNRDDVDAAVVVCQTDSGAAIDLIEHSIRTRPDRPVVVACTGSPNGYLRRLFAAGAEDVVIVTAGGTPGAETYMALHKAIARRSTAHGTPGGAGEIITTICPKGGAGKTVVSTNLAASLAAEGARTVIVDLDLEDGDVGLALGLRPDRTIHDLVAAGGSLDADKVVDFCMEHKSGLRALLAPTAPERAKAITPTFVRDVLGVLRSRFDAVVVDTPGAYSPVVEVALDASSVVIVVATLDAPGLKSAKIALERVVAVGHNPDQVRLVLNRSDASVGITHADVVSVLGAAPDILVPSTREVVRSLNAGEPIVLSAKRTEASKALRALGTLVANGVAR